MLVSFATVELAKLCSSAAALDRLYGPTRAARLRQRLFEIAGAPSSELLLRLPSLACVKTSRNGRSLITVRVDEALSVVLEEPSTPTPLGEIRVVELRE